MNKQCHLGTRTKNKAHRPDLGGRAAQQDEQVAPGRRCADAQHRRGLIRRHAPPTPHQRAGRRCPLPKGAAQLRRGAAAEPAGALSDARVPCAGPSEAAVHGASRHLGRVPQERQARRRAAHLGADLAEGQAGARAHIRDEQCVLVPMRHLRHTMRGVLSGLPPSVSHILGSMRTL